MPKEFQAAPRSSKDAQGAPGSINDRKTNTKTRFQREKEFRKKPWKNVFRNFRKKPLNYVFRKFRKKPLNYVFRKFRKTFFKVFFWSSGRNP